MVIAFCCECVIFSPFYSVFTDVDGNNRALDSNEENLDI